MNKITDDKNTTKPQLAYDRLLYAGFVCPYCGAKTEYIDSSFVYGRSYGMIYICKPCDAYVGVHKGTDNALGRLANKELREAKKQAHYYFDQIAKTGLINKIWKQFIPNTGNRNKAYLWLSKQMNIERELCHIGMFNVEQCQKVIEICSQHVY
jgi:predicted RNA-binding Zn-ribbon protein involved in translation (DUF1610 family)